MGSAKEDHVNRNRLIAGGALLVFLLILLPGSVLLRNEWKSRQASVNEREPVPDLGYCSSDPVTPCIVSFSLDADGQMLVNVMTEGTSYPNIYLKIRHSQGENIYPCRRVERFSTSVYCTGRTLSLGEIFQFFVLTANGDRLLAQGNFSIIGMAISTMDVFGSSVQGSPSTPLTSAPTDEFITGTPTLPGGTPTPTRVPSYPNPTSYPNPLPTAKP